MQPILLIHGGAGDISDDRVLSKLKGIKNTLRVGVKVLLDGGSSLDAVEVAVRCMECDENFNAGYGSVLNIEGVVAMDASIMEGTNLNAGCVTLLQDIMHPISVARKVMEKTNHSFIGGDSALKFARSENFEILPRGSLVTENAKMALEEFKEHQQNRLDTTYSSKKTRELGETVGAVAIDVNGNIAVATSTGGTTGKLPGRIGDTPILGSGTYADNQIGGVSSTGHGETIMRFNLAQRILQCLSHDQVSAQRATEDVTEQMTKRLGGTGGAITIDKQGDVGIHFTTDRMSWGYVKDNQLVCGINKGETFKEDL